MAYITHITRNLFLLFFTEYIMLFRDTQNDLHRNSAGQKNYQQESDIIIPILRIPIRHIIDNMD